MNRKLIDLSIVAVVLAGGAAAQAQQPFGRDSVHAVPGQPAGTVATRIGVQQSGRDSVYATNSSTRSSPVATLAGDKLGRDSVYATQMQADPSAPVATNAGGLQQNGRDSVYAIRSGTPTSPEAGTKVYGSGTGARHGG